MMPEQVIRCVDPVVDEHIHQFVVLAGPSGDEVGGFLGAWRVRKATGQQNPRDLGKSGVTRQLQQVEMEDHVCLQVAQNVAVAG
jgi:hypothetical protein